MDISKKLRDKYQRHDGKGKRRFLVRVRNNQYEVYGKHLEQICWAPDSETAMLIADGLEMAAEQGKINVQD